jgi:hypothetical protein
MNMKQRRMGLGALRQPHEPWSKTLKPPARRWQVCNSLGKPAANGIKCFAASELLELVKDRAWLVKVTNAVNQHWQRNNASKKNGSQNRHDLPTGKSSELS